jgi:hypothetical protein
MSAEHLKRTVANTIAGVSLHWNGYNKKPSDLYAAMADRLADAQLVQSPETAAELETLRARVAELEAAAKAIRHLHTDSPMGPCPVCVDADAMGRGEDYTVPFPCPTARLAGAKDCDPPYVSRLLPPRDAACAGCGHSGAEHHHGDTKCWAHLPKGHGDPIRLCVCEGFVAGSSVEVSADRLTRLLAPSQVLREDAYESPLHHNYRVSHDLPEPAHPAPCRFPKSPGCTCGLTGADVEPETGGDGRG